MPARPPGSATDGTGSATSGTRFDNEEPTQPKSARTKAAGHHEKAAEAHRNTAEHHDKSDHDAAHTHSEAAHKAHVKPAFSAKKKQVRLADGMSPAIPMMVPITVADGIVLDLRYVSADNLTGRPIYRRPVALLHPSARALLLAAARRFAAIGLRVKLFDAFRPMEAQQALWDALPNPRFVANPADGTSLHTRGVAVDVTLVDQAGADLPMGSGFDAMTPLSAHDALDLPAEAIRNRALLLGGMAAVGWQHIASEWWHYQLAGCEHLPQLSADDVPDGPM